VGDLKEKIPMFPFPRGFTVWELGVSKYLVVYPL